jgi:hypothetical protein
MSAPFQIWGPRLAPLFSLSSVARSRSLIPNQGEDRFWVLSVLYNSSRYCLYAGIARSVLPVCLQKFDVASNNVRVTIMCLIFQDYIGIAFAVLNYGIWKTRYWPLLGSDGNQVCKNYIAQCELTRQYIHRSRITHSPSIKNVSSFQHVQCLCWRLLGYSSFLRIPRNRIPFSLALCNIAQSDNTTPAGQPYVLATLPAFVADILRLLQSKASDISSSIKERSRTMWQLRRRGISYPECGRKWPGFTQPDNYAYERASKPRGRKGPKSPF